MEIEFILSAVGLVSAVGGAGAAWGATANRIKTLTNDLVEVKDELETHDKRTRGLSDRLARMETKIDILLQRKQ